MKGQGACEISWLKTRTSYGVGIESFLPIIIVLRGLSELKVKWISHPGDKYVLYNFSFLLGMTYILLLMSLLCLIIRSGGRNKMLAPLLRRIGEWRTGIKGWERLFPSPWTMLSFNFYQCYDFAGGYRIKKKKNGKAGACKMTSRPIKTSKPNHSPQEWTSDEQFNRTHTKEYFITYSQNLSFPSP